MDVPPSPTVYVRNLNERVKPAQMKSSLYYAFGRYGRILDVVVASRRNCRGQAWVVFQDVACATNALRQMQGVNVYGKKVDVKFAKGKSDATAKYEGTFVPRHGRSAPREAAEVEKVAAGPSKEGALAAAAAEAKAEAVTTPSSKGESNGSGGSGSAMEVDDSGEAAPPNKLLFVSNLPAETPAEALKALFGQYDGLRDMRLSTKAGKGIAFIEFGDEFQASTALQGLQGFKLTPTDEMSVVFAKK